jgi:LPXTG-site transpeptidase (sortase) family protein
MGSDFDSGLFGKGNQFTFTFTKTGEYLYFCTRHNSMRAQVNVTAATSTSTDDAAVAQAEAAPPERLVIPAINVDLQPVPVGLDEQRLPLVPRHDVGWFTGSAQPGQGSNVIFWGHVLRWKDTPNTAAPFERLHELQPGAEITVFSNNQAQRYEVTEQIQVRPENVAYLLPTAEERLTFVSCIGDNVIVTGTLTKEFRLVTIAKPIA